MKEVLKCEYTDTVAVTTTFFLTGSAQILSTTEMFSFSSPTYEIVLQY